MVICCPSAMPYSYVYCQCCYSWGYTELFKMFDLCYEPKRLPEEYKVPVVGSVNRVIFRKNLRTPVWVLVFTYTCNLWKKIDSNS